MTDETAPSLPPVVTAAWGLREQGRRGPRAELTLDRIVTTAIAVADADGLAAVSMARVAADLGFSTMSLYRHVASKEELLQHMQDAALGDPDPASTDDLSWREGLRTWARAVIGTYLAHPWSVDLTAAGPPVMPRNTAWMDWALRIMADLPLSSTEKLSTLILVSGYARYEATMMIGFMRGRAAGIEAVDDDDYQRALLHLTDAERFPFVHAVASDTTLFEDVPAETSDEADAWLFSYGLERILDGIEAHLSRRG